MSADEVRAAVLLHWQLANARDWTGFAALLHPALQYDTPQTREYIDGGTGYLEMFRTWPGEWRASVRQLVCEPDRAVCVFDFTIGDQVETGISAIRFEDGLVRQIEEWWPAPYDPPPRATPHMRRRG